jgi:hypothetical protein
MEVDIRFSSSAFKHGIAEENIRYALNHLLYEGPIEDDESKFLILGFDSANNLLEVMYNCIDDETVNVFHAMKCRRIYHFLLDE